ncbi:MAG: lytic murein transglycosylase B [Kistimonas sp.]|nr:lytic murein transglycosylase B [Kistimonas sp.]
MESLSSRGCLVSVRPSRLFPKKKHLFFQAALLAGLLLGASGESAAFEKKDKDKEIKEIIKTLSRDGIDPGWLEKAFAGAEFKSRIIELISKPAERRLVWWEYRNLLISEHRIKEGAKFWKTHEKTLIQAEQKWGVPPAIILGILGVETGFGSNTGGFRVMDALYTLGLGYPRRAKFFKKELHEFLRLANAQNMDPLSLTGSYAGAMGVPQFMPSSYREYAVDFDGDGQTDIWHSMTDSIGSVAAYLQRHGWQAGLPVALPARITKPVYKKFIGKGSPAKPEATLGKAKRMGWIPDSKEPLALSNRRPLLVRGLKMALEDDDQGQSRSEYWLTTKNFYALTRYNISNLYAMAVWRLGQEIEKVYRSDQESQPALTSHTPPQEQETR